jgi:hypothetical protein
MQFVFQLGSFVYTHIVDHMCTSFRLAQNSTCARPSGSLRSWGGVSVAGLWQIYLASGLMAVTNETLELVMRNFMEIDYKHCYVSRMTFALESKITDTETIWTFEVTFEKFYAYVICAAGICSSWKQNKKLISFRYYVNVCSSTVWSWSPEDGESHDPKTGRKMPHGKKKSVIWYLNSLFKCITYSSLMSSAYLETQPSDKLVRFVRFRIKPFSFKWRAFFERPSVLFLSFPYQ